jgi:hypothetical protein
MTRKPLLTKLSREDRIELAHEQEKLRRERLRQEKQRQKEPQKEQHQPIDAARRVPDHWRLYLLQERNPKRARELFAELTGNELQDRAILELFEELVERAIYAGAEHIKLRIGLAEAIAILLKAVPIHGRPRLPREKRIRRNAIFSAAREKQKYLIDKKVPKEQALSTVKREIETDPAQRVSRIYDEWIRKVEADPARPVSLNLEVPKLKAVSLKEALGKEGKDYTAATIKDRLQRRKPRTGK